MEQTYKADLKAFKKLWTDYEKKHGSIDETTHFMPNEESPIYDLIDTHWGSRSSQWFADFAQAGYSIQIEIWDHDYNCHGSPNILQYACRYGKTSLALAVLQWTNVDEPDLHGYAPLTYACFNGQTDLAMALINKGSNMNARSAFYYACRNKLIPIIEAMIYSDSFNINTWCDEDKSEVIGIYLFNDDLAHYAVGLINSGKMDTTLKNNDGHDLLEEAKFYKMDTIIEAIEAIEANRDENSQNS